MTAADPHAALRLLQAHLEARAAEGRERLWLTPEARQALREIVKSEKQRLHPGAAARVREDASGTSTGEPGGGEAPGSFAEMKAALRAAASASAAVVPALQNHPARRETQLSQEEAVAAAVPETPAAGTPQERERMEERQRVQAAEQERSSLDSPAGEEGERFVQETPEMETLNLEQTPAHAENPALSKDEKERLLAEVRARAETGERARALGTLRDKMVFAVGNPDAQIMLVGEAPGADEERQGEPFVGKAGQLLTRILKAMGLEREDVYISNICKYRPAMQNQTTGNRPPTADEMDSCIEFVREEIRIVRPRVIVALGGTAALGLLKKKESVGRMRGRFHEMDGVPVMVTFHPSYLLRQEAFEPQAALAEKRKLWEDMLQVMERLEMPVTEKQRRYFLSA